MLNKSFDKMKVQIHFLLIVIALPLVFSFNPENRYCRIRGCQHGTHTMCVYNMTTTSNICERVIRAGLTEMETWWVLQVHNFYRQKVYSGFENRGAPGPQPAALYDETLVWDEELAEIAQRWANQCMLFSDFCRNVDILSKECIIWNPLERFSVGQNVIWGDFDEDMNQDLQLGNLQELIESWYHEVARYNSNHVGSFSSRENSTARHYIRMIWEKTFRLGCGAVRFYRERFPVPKIFLVCNYAPNGNIPGQPVYETIE